ncbi:hypothetical protein ASG31_10275 [Chryseobacterium sp. Leaf404]|uniref:hypothetical protein n=1 Tax=unclassified Chryseobacterium TaxID=2593645 RepID=UPI0006FD84A9|nr:MULTISPECIES: hypothetical protein [unclassified Chryseobacterium]KQT16758.1 hypothetical protein ASG31_10275 [Chryseobacterium sp. Leaf404]
MRKKYYQLILLAFSVSSYSKTWKALVAEDFGTSVTNGVSSNPSNDLLPGTTSYTPINTANTLVADGSYAVVSNTGTPHTGSPRSYNSWIPNAPDHTINRGWIKSSDHAPVWIELDRK